MRYSRCSDVNEILPAFVKRSTFGAKRAYKQAPKNLTLKTGQAGPVPWSPHQASLPRRKCPKRTAGVLPATNCGVGWSDLRVMRESGAARAETCAENGSGNARDSIDGGTRIIFLFQPEKLPFCHGFLMPIICLKIFIQVIICCNAKM